VGVTLHFDPTSVITAFGAGTAHTWVTILLASWRVSRLNIVRAIRDLPEPGTPERSRDFLIAGILTSLAGLALTAWGFLTDTGIGDRKSTRLNSSHQIISYAVFCLKKKKNTK